VGCCCAALCSGAAQIDELPVEDKALAVGAQRWLDALDKWYDTPMRVGTCVDHWQCAQQSLQAVVQRAVDMVQREAFSSDSVRNMGQSHLFWKRMLKSSWLLPRVPALALL
jgi:hypothetical protein